MPGELVCWRVKCTLFGRLTPLSVIAVHAAGPAECRRRGAKPESTSVTSSWFLQVSTEERGPDQVDASYDRSALQNPVSAASRVGKLRQTTQAGQTAAEC
ncbi:hypothetical protein Bbelb_223760 [Branchiostoma belcheri]|nr:hypothetical protein Bbelb_223760 [Branchiostoma belcheri]